MTEPKKCWGGVSALFGFLVWGLFPVYWKQLHAIPPLEAVAHRAIWSLLFLLGVLAVRGELTRLLAIVRDRRQLGLSAISSVLLAGNWGIYIWAVNSGHVIEASLGYFLVPLVNVALGRIFFGEKVRPIQAGAIALAAVGVGILLVRLGHFPIIALGLAGTWSTYGVLKKRSALGPIVGLTVETVVMMPVAILFLAWVARSPTGIQIPDTRTALFLVGAGLVTALPLVAFAHGAQQIRLTTLGLLQYVTPSVQFLLGYFVYQEQFDATHWQAYGMIWSALAIYSAESLWHSRIGRERPRSVA